MMNNYIKTNKKGITPIIAIVLLLMMTVGAFGLTAVWVTETQEQMQNETTQQFLDTARKTSSSLSIVSIYNDAGKIVVVAKNTGRYPFNDVSDLTVYVGGRYVSMSWFGSGEINPGKTVRGNVSDNSIDWTYLENEAPVTIKVEPPVGTPASKTCIPALVSSGSCG